MTSKEKIMQLKYNFSKGFSMKYVPRLIPVVLFLVLNAACARDRNSFRHPEADFSSITRVAVIPFENYTNSQYAGDIVTMIYMSELLMNVDVEVVEPGEVARALGADGTRAGKLSQSEIKSIGSALKADTCIFGTVQEYGTVRVRNENYPVVSVNVRWVDAQTGTIIFMASVSEEGSPQIPVIDVGEEQLYSVLARRACRKLVNMVR
ncbi:MAG: hypothetical protein C4520_09075 [Candidatus Abyssobacteria bacterium SURF_5]|uniref:FlgO domain-containing protein n=1 Tax=Abyssobacteria bacterium (strain SURF_5) TaxID=2093360 RepID=A0A3A4NSL8_ABYX5|nr:MAG: hypothetical protein C4520_09075 [Candidatus Abyssubacteria bacterium SURF_5]